MVDDAISVVLDGIIGIFIASFPLRNPGVVRAFVQIVHAPIEAIEIQMDIVPVRRLAAHGIVQVCDVLILDEHGCVAL